MNTLKKFDEYIRKGIARKCNPDPLRAKDILQQAERDFNFLGEIRNKLIVRDEIANNLINQGYAILIELLRAKMLIDGFKASGYAAHEAEVSYLGNLGFLEADSMFMDELRSSRNGIFYQGKKFDAEYCKKVLSFLDRLYPRLHHLAHKNDKHPSFQ